MSALRTQPASSGGAEGGGGSWMRLRLSGVAMPESCQMTGTLYLGLLTDTVDVKPGTGVENTDKAGGVASIFQ